ncbi:Kelch repeat-containing protein [Echinicola shivajiensis]|uniref:Kelch repeat-containing protein n=1 Tax=Echinicola shivajiensis TaxID=1035916 RepID=UPI001BFC5BF7|nr:kelch repeat-containing protein [Echinicola shivajiensis]
MLKVRFINILFSLVGIIALSSSCVSDEEETSEGNWVRRSYFDGDNRSNAASFTIGERAFIMGGYTGDDYLNDFWEYNPTGDYWERKADFPGKSRSNAVAFSIDGKGYVGTGYDGTDKLKDFWEYDPETNSWRELAEFGGTARYDAVGFSLMDKGYIGTGYDGSEQKDFWQYDPTTDSWKQIISMGGAKRQGAVAFVIDDIAYIGTGINNGSYEFDLWALDGNTLEWTEKRPIDYDDDYLIYRSNANAFTIGNYGYITVGNRGSILGSTWEYRPSTDEWLEKTDFEGTFRTGASVFSINNQRAYILLGKSSSLRFDDIWEFEPFVDYNDED